LGTIIGAGLLQAFERTHEAYLTLFLVSGCLRACCLLALPDRRQAVATTLGAVQAVRRQVGGRIAQIHGGGRVLSGLHQSASVVGESKLVRETPA
jgi:hypothetical protein